MQIAASFDNFGEDDNPTEAGSREDGARPASSSRLIKIVKLAPNSLRTSTQAAYWRRRGAIKLSDTIFFKNVTIGLTGLPNVILLLTTVRTVHDRKVLVTEVPAFYAPAAFSTMRLYDSRTRRVSPAPEGFIPTDKVYPLLSAAGGYTFGIYASSVPDLYDVRDLRTEGNCMKINRIGYHAPAPAKDYNYRTYICLGLLADVTSAMDALIARGL